MIAESIAQKFKTIVGKDNCWTDATDLHTYAYDAAVVEPVRPGIVVRPTTTEALGQAVRLCNDHGLPLTVRGAGTNLSGGTVPLENGVVVVTNGLKSILEINEADMYAVVQPGVVTAKLAAAVEAKGLFYPPDPGSQAVSTIGGNVAENAGGLRGLKYGVTRDYVMGLSFFDVEGNLVKSGSRTVKCATGYNLTGLMVGSEGTLGVFAEIILKLIPLPAHRKAMMAVFESMEKASEAVAAIIADRIVPATLEFLDNFTIRAVEDFSKAGLPVDAAAMLLVELDGHKAQVEEDAARVEALCQSMGATSIRVAQDAAERDRVWAARRAALSALAQLKPTLVLEDATVPRSRIPDMVAAIQAIAKRYDLTIGTFGHAGDGNLHPTILTDKRDTTEWGRVEKAIDDIFDEALKMGGTLSGEHGTGTAKSRYLENETGAGTILFSSRIKRAMDPKNILNPGKIIAAKV
ncbi:FAD-linked oxidase C-terminal domain-containing protein [uncultured Desulfosarcina sp.]|uniref:FAD-binding oxidoreductase n=1 Tax=uncultured Desulfosarcina sp. TaxID=218289 RepID=UPI0029C7D91C|nr:FAD-linked oxidase C-terminal domain-containing protein [uncultured Desulfosarcina sp.]